jgi:hypothetical protein
MLSNPVLYDRDTLSAKFMDICCQFPASILDVSAATREHWWMNQKWLELNGDAHYIRKWLQCMGCFLQYHPITVPVAELYMCSSVM